MGGGGERRARREAIVLVGMRAAGKTTLGRALAAALDAEFLDLDELLERRHRASCAELIARRGVGGFRRLEEAELRALARELRVRRAPSANGGGHVVIATGGGVVEHAASRRLLPRLGTVVWLQAPLADVERRIAASSRPPLLAGSPGSRGSPGSPGSPGSRGSHGAAEEARRLLRRRGPLYREVADLVVRQGSRSPAVLAAILASRLAVRDDSRLLAHRRDG
jgi:shikimate kinase